MTPEQLRMLTDALASAGAAIGGKGSAGDLIGQTVIARNRRDDVMANTQKLQVDKEKRDAMRGAEWFKLMQGVPGMTAQSGKTENKSDWISAMSQFPDMVSAQDKVLTPPDQPGMTSIGMGKDGQVTTTFTPNITETGLSPEQYKSAIATRRANKTADVSNEYTQILTEQAKNSLITGKPMKVSISGQDFMVTPAKAMDYTRGKYGDVTAAEQTARVEKAKLSEAPGGGVVTAGEIGKFNLQETATPTDIKVAKTTLAKPELGTEMRRNKRAGAVNLGEVKAKRAATNQANLESGLRNPDYGAKLQKRIDATDEGMMALSKMKHTDPNIVAEGKTEYNNAFNRAMFADYKNVYSADGSKVVIKLYKDVPWIVRKTSDGEIVKLRELTGAM